MKVVVVNDREKLGWRGSRDKANFLKHASTPNSATTQPRAFAPFSDEFHAGVGKHCLKRCKQITCYDWAFNRAKYGTVRKVVKRQ